MRPDLVPMRWPAEWSDPARLELIRDTPINCLVGKTAPPFPLGDIEFVEESAAPDGVALREGKWPSVQGGRQADTVDAGPTGGPWVDSNAAVIRLAQAMEPDKTVWLTYPPPAATEVVPFTQLPVPVAEAEAYGARWVITLQDPLRDALGAGDAEALAAWKKMVAVLEFSRQHAEWRDWRAVAKLGVISDFEGDNEFLGAEFLNLAPRDHLAYRIILKESAMEASLEGLRAVLVIDAGPPQGALAGKLVGFAEAGGTLIVPSAMPGAGAPAESRHGYNVYRQGRGRIIAPGEPWEDPYLLAQDVHLLVSHREDVVRVWNAGPMNSHYLAPESGTRGVVHLVKYGESARRMGAVTLGFAEPYSTARIFTLDAVDEVKTVKSRMGVEVPLPNFAIYAAIELRG